MNTVVLQFPVTWGSEQVSELTINRPKVKDLKGLNLKAIEESATEQVKLLSRLCGQPAAFFDEIDMQDYQKIMLVLMSFFPDSPMSGDSQ